MANVPPLTKIYTPGGRLVQGDLVRKGDKNYENQPIPVEDQEYYFAVAVRKDAPGVNELLGLLQGLAISGYQNVPPIMAQINMGLAATDFSWKIDDGDLVSYDNQGQPKKIPDYNVGCYIFKFRSKYEFGGCDENGVEINRADIKKGDYIDVMFTATLNGRMDGNAGIILYPNAVRRLGFGEAIATGISASEAFSGRASTAPVGATGHPTAGGMTPAPVQQQQMQPAPVQQQQMQPAPVQQQQMQPAPVQGDMGNLPAAVGNPASTQTQQPVQNVQGGMGLPAASTTPSTASPSDMGVQPHTNILMGPQT